jgi:hypothetical protein
MTLRLRKAFPRVWWTSPLPSKIVPPEPHRDERKSAAPWFSPGLVRADEVVLRTILDPDHLGPDGKLASAAIALGDIRFRGWSVDRKHFTGRWRVRLSHSGWKKRKPNLLRIHVLPVPVGQFRRPDPTTGNADFVVTDTAMWLNPAHADVLLSGPQSEGAARGFRNKLLETLPPYVDLTAAFDSTGDYGYLRGMLRQFAAIVISAFRYIFRST